MGPLLYTGTSSWRSISFYTNTTEGKKFWSNKFLTKVYRTMKSKYFGTSILVDQTPVIEYNYIPVPWWFPKRRSKFHEWHLVHLWHLWWESTPGHPPTGIINMSAWNYQNSSWWREERICNFGIIRKLVSQLAKICIANNKSLLGN